LTLKSINAISGKFQVNTLVFFCFLVVLLQQLEENMASNTVHWQCTWCGAGVTRGKASGRPSPGNCPRKPKTKDGKYKPHTWVKG